MPRPVSYTIQSVTSGECVNLSFSRQSDGQGGIALIGSATFDLLDEDDVVVGRASVSLQLTTPQRNSLNGIINSVFVPALNSQEGL